MELVVNGERRHVADGSTVAQLLESLSIQPERVVVEVNLTVLKRAQHPTTVLKAGDQVEIVQLVGGGSRIPSRHDAGVGLRVSVVSHHG